MKDEGGPKIAPVRQVNARIVYMECKTGPSAGSARIGRVTVNRSGRSLQYRDLVFRRLVGGAAKANYINEATGAEYWISGCKRRGNDRLHGSEAPVAIDEDVREEYWQDIRKSTERAKRTSK